MKRILLFILIVLTLTSCNAKDTNNESSEETPQKESSSVALEQSSEEETESKIEAVEALTDDEKDSAAILYEEYGLTMTPDLLPKSEHEKELLCRLGAEIARQAEEVAPEFEAAKKYSGHLFAYIYDDFDNDGACEMYATASLVASSGIWFIDDKAAAFLTGDVGMMTNEEPIVLNMQNRKFVVFKAYFAVARTKDYVYGVRDGKPFETSISRWMIEGQNEYSEVLLIQTTYDAFIDGGGDILGRTWKPYYFYMDETGDFKEYIGVEVNLDFVRSMNGAQEILKEHLPEEAKIESIYYRDNGVVNINYFVEERGGKAMSYITLRYDGLQTHLEAVERGTYNSSLKVYN